MRLTPLQLGTIGSAAAAFVAGLAAVVTGEAVVAVAAGLLAVATAIVAVLVTVGSPEPEPAEPEVDGDDAEPEPVVPMVDEASGLFGSEFLDATLDGRVATAKRVLRPLALVLFEVVRAGPEGEPLPVEPSAITGAIKATLRESDLACRASDGAYAMILEDTSEDGAVWTAERVRRNLALGGENEHVFRAGVAAYPNHGLDATELRRRAEHALGLARDWHRDRIEVATPV